MEKENIQTSKRKAGLKEFFSKYGYYLAIAFLVGVLAVGIVLTSVGVATDEEKTTPTNVKVISFGLPIANGTITKGYSDTELQFNKNMNIWELHRAVDFSADIGADVLASYDGKVTKITTNILNGTTIEIDHGNNLKTTYGSLSSTTNVNVGDMVKKGDIIGKASNTATSEVSDNGEVHFEVWKDGNLVDPASYLNIAENK